MKIEENHAVFSTGKKEYAIHGIIGIGENLNIFSGYDDHFGGSNVGGLSDAEMIELCDYMIEQWTKLKSIHVHKT